MPSGSMSMTGLGPERLPSGTRVKIISSKSGHGYPIGMEASILRYSGTRNILLADPADPSRELGGGYVLPEDVIQIFTSREEQAAFLETKVAKFEGLAKEFKAEVTRLRTFETDAEEMADALAKIMASGGDSTKIHAALLGTGKFIS